MTKKGSGFDFRKFKLPVSGNFLKSLRGMPQEQMQRVIMVVIFIVLAILLSKSFKLPDPVDTIYSTATPRPTLTETETATPIP